MNQSLHLPKASVIISVYKDTEALRCILWGLEQQSERNFEIIVTEDGESDEMSGYLRTQKETSIPVTHLTQTDDGFRKTRAVNRAAATAKAPYLIFLDGDCIPRPRHVALHLQCSAPGLICTGRKINLGVKGSALIRQKPSWAVFLNNKISYILLAIPLFLDRTRNYEAGIGGRLFHKIPSRHIRGIIGANWSCYKEDMIKINGYNEDLPGIGGEDDDLDWRFRGIGMSYLSTKFLTPVYLG